ncbi:MAG: hypothetical protein N2485_02100 [bacterium]|nr:hypothetical protein [bacterium]
MNSLLKKMIFILLFITLIFYIIFSLKNITISNFYLNYSQINYNTFNAIYNNYSNYLDENLSLLRKYFYESFIKTNKNNLKIIYCQVANYSILTKLEKISKKSNEYIYILIFPVIRIRKTDELIIKQEADKYINLTNSVIYLIDKELKEKLDLKYPIKIIVFDYNKLIIEK